MWLLELNTHLLWLQLEMCMPGGAIQRGSWACPIQCPPSTGL
ncbi:hypothetical protein Celaphus_00006261 [Cervus elaphus hippelaphus]|uniref:Uncharacterized protein n=1 Tax=Cervus elaphus hippelaphus TaxID=46360 RepID=A0A212CUD2_CEREH|nr:hypothetical protein Celaphus_00006261 [Cervus elaphus hippelaphus]